MRRTAGGWKSVVTPCSDPISCPGNQTGMRDETFMTPVAVRSEISPFERGRPRKTGARLDGENRRSKPCLPRYRQGQQCGCRKGGIERRRRTRRRNVSGDSGFRRDQEGSSEAGERAAAGLSSPTGRTLSVRARPFHVRKVRGLGAFRRARVFRRSDGCRKQLTDCAAICSADNGSTRSPGAPRVNSDSV
jgi:hypothetical protein